MNAKTKKILILTGIISLVCFAPTVFAQPPEGGPGDFGGPGGPGEFGEPPKEAMENFAKDLELTPEQQAQIKAQREEQKTENQAIRKELKTKHQELRQELEKATIDEAKVKGLVSSIAVLESRKLSQHVAGVIAMKKILTPEQQAKMKAKMEERKTHRQGKKGGMREHMKERFFSK